MIVKKPNAKTKSEGRPAPSAEIERRGTAALPRTVTKRPAALHQATLQPDEEGDDDQEHDGGRADDTVFGSHGGVDTRLVEKGRDRLDAARAAEEQRDGQHLDADDEIQHGRINDRGADHRDR